MSLLNLEFNYCLDFGSPRCLANWRLEFKKAGGDED